MTTKLRVRVSWPNAGLPLLPDAGADVQLLADGAALKPVTSSRGLRVFDVPEGTSQLELKAVFTVSFRAVRGPAPKTSGFVNAPAMSGEVLRAEQRYAVAGAQLTAETIADFGGPHPLVVTKGAANKNGVVAITLRTEFVDIEPFWEKYCAFWQYYLGEHTGNTTTHVLGYTGGGPLVWLANVPNGLATYDNGHTSCLVFYRPANTYTYSRLDRPHEATAISRYFLKPKPDTDASAQPWEHDHLGPDGFNLVRCRFEDAIDDSRRALVMLHPWPSGTDFGAAATAALPSLCEGAIRLLRAKKALCKGVANVSLGRLGLSGFSLGGEAMWAALRANMARVGEVYAFDCEKSHEAQGDIVQWFNSHDSAFLRLVGGVYNIDRYNAIARTISPSRRPRPGLTVTPKDDNVYELGNNVVWEHYISPRPDKRNHKDTRHQFAICGGTMPGNIGPYDLELTDTFLATFLKMSAFNRL